MSYTRSFSLLILSASIATLSAATVESAASGLWSSNDLATWNPAGNPLTGSVDSVLISNGHEVIFAGTSNVGLPGSNDLGIAGGQSITIDGGGVLSQNPPNFWIRIGHGSDGTLNINDGRFHFTNSLAAASPNLQVGLRGGSGFINIGDGVGAAGSAVMNLRDTVDGTRNEAAVSMNLGMLEGTNPAGLAGTIVIKSDGLLESDARGANPAGANPVVRIGQAGTATHALSSISVDGGLFRAHGHVELGSTNVGTDRANGGLYLLNGGRMEQDGGGLDIGYNGDGETIVTNAVYSKTNAGSGRVDIHVGREAAGVGNLVIGDGGQFRIEAGDVADLRVGLRGTGTMTINSGGLFQRDAGNWDWIGQEAGSNGTLTINAGGTFRTTGGSNFNIGVNAGATGLVVVNGGTLEFTSTTNAGLRIGQNGNGTFRQVSGTTNVQFVNLAENSGTAIFELQGGTFTSRSSFFVGGATAGSTGTGTGTVLHSGGTLNAGGAFVIGLAPGHTGTYTMTGGQIFHTASDISVGESGIGTMTIGAGATFTDTTGGQFFVGRNDGSSGRLIVNGDLSRTAASGLRIGNGNTAGVDNTNAPGVLGGTGSITSNVRIGTLGTLSGGTPDDVGTLNISGALSFSAGGTLFANFGLTGESDQINLSGTADISGAVLDGNWLAGGETGLSSRYWLLINDGVDSIIGTLANVSPTSPFASLYPEADAWASIDGQDFAVFYDGDADTGALTGGNDLLLSAVPEPSTVLLLGGAMAVTMLRRRRARA